LSKLQGPRLVEIRIKLYAPLVDGDAPWRASPDNASVILRKPIGPEHAAVARRVSEQFGTGWASEARVALGNRPVSHFIAIRSGALLGFCCCDATARGFVGPIGVAEQARGSGLGAALLRACVDDMRTMGCAYAVAGAVGELAFFHRIAGATEIEGSTPGIYRGMLKP